MRQILKSTEKQANSTPTTLLLQCEMKETVTDSNTKHFEKAHNKTFSTIVG